MYAILVKAMPRLPPLPWRSVPDDPPPPPPVADVIPPGVKQIDRLTPEAFQEHPVWTRVPFLDPAKPIWQQFAFRPWTGPVPVDPSEPIDFVVSATFILRNGTEYPGYIRPILENWADVVPPPTVLPGTTIQLRSLRERHGDTGLSIVEAQLPAMFVGNDVFRFWCGPRFDPEEQRIRLYESLGKTPDDIFPITFHAAPGLATGVVSGEIHGFYEPTWMRGKTPQLIR